MATQKIKTTTIKNVRKKKTGGDTGYIKCPKCNGSGRIKDPKGNDKK